MWNWGKSWFRSDKLSDGEFREATSRLIKQAPIPVIWLFGKTGSGKSSIIRYLTGVESIAVGTGYQPETKFSSRYDFPDETEPVLRFLDTRGLGEVSYRPDEDIAAFEEEAHLMIVVVRVMDHAVDELVSALRAIRKAAPRRPVLLVLTALHDAYPGEQHPAEDPFGLGPFPMTDQVSENLSRSLERQYETFKGLFDRAVPIDLTPAEEGFDEPAFGGQRLKTAIIESLPAAYRQTLMQLDEVVTPLEDQYRRKAMPYLLGTSTLAATAAAVPVPWVDIPVVMGLQSHLAYKMAKIYRQPIDSQTIARVSGVVGGGVAVRMAVRGTLKFIPWVGMAANAATAFAYTFATGMVWIWYFSKVRAGHMPNDEELRDVFRSQLLKATELWKKTRGETPPA